MKGLFLQSRQFRKTLLAVEVKEGVVFQIFEIVQFGQRFVLEAIVMGSLVCFQQGFLDDWLWIWGLFWDDAFTP
jgi:hypothetical protein